MNILAIIDDKESELFALLLRSDRFIIFPFSGWKIFLKWFAENEVDCVILDLAIAFDMDGFELGEIIKTIRPKVKLLFITGREITSEHIEWAQELGAEIVTKHNIDKCVERIRETLLAKADLIKAPEAS